MSKTNRFPTFAPQTTSSLFHFARNWNGGKSGQHRAAYFLTGRCFASAKQQKVPQKGKPPLFR